MEVNKNIQELSFANVIGDRFGRYSKYIIQDRALPDVRDGLKPVQRRILYAMHEDRNHAGNPYRKSAKTVGNVIGNYHPHGDFSVYEAMVRMSQDWKVREPLIDMHGNKGSMDGDPAAAMRYTEARLSLIASELLADIDEETVEFQLNFDDTMEEPLVLPARYPNLLVNGATGISAGYATEIPSHNLGEVIDAVVYMLTHEKYSLDQLMNFIKGPDFPTGGIIQGVKDIKKAYQKGQGKITVVSKTAIEPLRGGRFQIVVSEIPYDVNKARLIQKIDDIRLSRKIEGIGEVRDETDKDGVRIVIELRKDVDAEGVLNYLLLNTELQINYHFNMIAIHNLRPQLLPLIDMLEAYIDFQHEVITRRTNFRLSKAQKRIHIVEGLIRVVSILEEVIHTIRNSQNKADAKNNIMAAFDFSEKQAEAIVNLQLYRLTNTDITTLEEEDKDLRGKIASYQEILNDPKVLNQTLIQQLKAFKKQYPSPRRTLIEEEVEEISVEQHVLIPEEDVYVSVTNEGYIKRTSERSYRASQAQDLGRRELDYPIYVEKMSTHDDLILITNKGNYLHIPVHELPDIRWNDMGIHFSQQYQLEVDEEIIAAFHSQAQSGTEATLVLTTAKGMVKQSLFNLFTTYRSYKTRTASCMRLDGDDYVVAAHLAQVDKNYEIAFVTRTGYGLRYELDQISTIGLRTKGVIAMRLAEDDVIVASFIYEAEDESRQLMLLTQRGHLKRCYVEILAQTNRGTQGVRIIRKLKSNPHELIGAVLLTDISQSITLQGDTGEVLEVLPTDISLTDRSSNGSLIKELDRLGRVINLHPTILEVKDSELN